MKLNILATELKENCGFEYNYNGCSECVLRYFCEKLFMKPYSWDGDFCEELDEHMYGIDFSYINYLIGLEDDFWQMDDM